MQTRSGARSHCYNHITSDPRVRLRVGNELYELEATRVQDEAELSLVRRLNERKYGTDPEGWEEPPWVYHLDPR